MDDDGLLDCDGDIELGEDDEDALLADDLLDSGRYGQPAEDVLDLNPENDLECELTTGLSKHYQHQDSAFDNTHEEESDTNRQDNSFNVLQDESDDDEDKDNSNRDRFKSERSQILPPISSIAIPDSLENVVPRVSSPEAPRDRWQHGRRGKRGAGGRPMGQIRPSCQLPFAQQNQNRGNHNQRGGYRPRFQHRGGHVPNVTGPKRILINPHFQGAVQPQPGSGRLVWDTANYQDPPMNTFQPPAVDHFQHTGREPRPLQGRSDEPAPWMYQEQALPSPWLEGFGPGSDPNTHYQQNQLQHQQEHHLQNQQHQQPDMRYQQPNTFAAQPFPQPAFNSQPIGSNEAELEQLRFEEQRRISHEQLRINHEQLQEEERQLEMDFQARWAEEQRHEALMRMEDSMAPPVQNYERQVMFTRNANTFDRHEREMEEPPARTFAGQPHFSAPPPQNADFYPRPPTNSAFESSDSFPYRSPARQCPPGHQLPPLFSQPPPILPVPLGQHNQAPPLLNKPPPMHGQGVPGFNRPQNLNNLGPAMHNKLPSFNNFIHPYHSPSHSSSRDERPFRSLVPQSPYQSPTHSVSSGLPDFDARQTIGRPIRHVSPPPQQLSMNPFVQPNRNQPQTHQQNQQQTMQNRRQVLQVGQQSQKMRLAAENGQQAEPNRRVVLSSNLQQVRSANESLRANLQQVRSISAAQDPALRARPIQEQGPRMSRQQITTQNKAAPLIRQQAPSIRLQSSSTRQPGPSRQPGSTFRHPGPAARQQRPIRQQGPALRQQGPSVRQQGPSVRQQGPFVPQQGPSIRLQGPSVRQQGPSVRQQGPSVRQQGPSVRQQGPTNRQRGLNQPDQQAQAQVGPSLRLVSATKRHQGPFEDEAKRARLAAPELASGEAENPYMEEAEEGDDELRNYRAQIAKQKKLRDAVLLAKETRRQQGVRDRLLALEQQQQAEVGDQDALQVGEAIATIVNAPLIQRRMGQNGNQRR